MTNYTLNIDDRVRDLHVQTLVDIDRPVWQVIDRLIGEYGLPRRDVTLNDIEYRLVRVSTDTEIDSNVTLREIGVRPDEWVQLVSESGRRIWLLIQRLLDEIESEFEERITASTCHTATSKLAQIERTLAHSDRIERNRSRIHELCGTFTSTVLDETQKRVSSNRIGWILALGFVIVIVSGLAFFFDGDDDGGEATATATEPSASVSTPTQLGTDTPTSTSPLGLTATDTPTPTATDTPTPTATIIDLSPTVTILSPASDLELGYDGYDDLKDMWFKDVDFAAEAIDPEDGDLTGERLIWTTDQTNLQEGFLGKGKIVIVRLYSNSCEGGARHKVTVTATDSSGHRVSASKSVYIRSLC